MLLPSNGESWVTVWGTRSGKRSGGVGSAMVIFFLFLDVAALLCVSEVEPGAQKIRSDLKKVNTSWSI
jgi:hypothetical protein